MPIRFRCPTCTGLMSIARRKANAVVACPKCGERVVVPASEPAAVVAAGNGAPDRPLFERPDFDSLLVRAGVADAPEREKAVAAPQPPTGPPTDDRLVLSYPAAVGLGVACAALVTASFAAGYLLK